MTIKRILITSAILTSILLVSCNKEKDYVCVCTDYSTSPPAVSNHKVHTTKDNAEFECTTIPTSGNGGCKLQ